MSINKNAIIRYQTLDKCFRNRGRKCYWQDLLEACNEALRYLDPQSTGIRRRQLFEDIRFMESEKGWSVPLERVRDGKRVFYRYEDPQFSINNSPLTETESKQLKTALQFLSRFKGSEQFLWMEELIPRLEQLFEIKNNTKEIIHFEQTPYLKGLEYLGTLFEAVANKQPLEIIYQSFKKMNPDSFIIHPYYLKQFNQRWFLLGQNEKYKHLTILALDRIISVNKTNLSFIENRQYDFSEYFEDVIGIYKGKDDHPVKVTLWFSPNKAPYILTKPLHGSQKKKSYDDTGLIITIEVILNYELKSLLLSFGKDVKVLSPKELDKELQDIRYQ